MKLKYSFEPVDMGEEVIFVAVGTGADQVRGVLKLNKEGQEICDMLKEEITREEIVDRLASKYTNDRETLGGWVDKILSTLEQAKLLED